MARSRKRGVCAKRSRKAQETKAKGEGSAARGEKVPKTFVFHRGSVGRHIKELILDLRKVFEPNTATHLQAQRKNSLKDFVSVAGPLEVTHFVVLTRTDVGVNLRLMRLPRGPTLTFRGTEVGADFISSDRNRPESVKEYCLMRNVVSSLKRPQTCQFQLGLSPLLIMNNFNHTKDPCNSEKGGENAASNSTSLMLTMFQNLLPKINVNQVKLPELKRCVLLNLNQDSNEVDFRHYAIKTVPSDVNRVVRKVAVGNKVPKLGKYNDISDYFLNPAQTSESEFEPDDPANQVEVPDNPVATGTKGKLAPGSAAVRLTELGPRLRLQLIKIEDGISNGEVLFHNFNVQTEDEIAAKKKLRLKKKRLKVKRKMEQDKNVERKRKLKDEMNAKAVEGQLVKKKKKLMKPKFSVKSGLSVEK